MHTAAFVFHLQLGDVDASPGSSRSVHVCVTEVSANKTEASSCEVVTVPADATPQEIFAAVNTPPVQCPMQAPPSLSH